MKFIETLTTVELLDEIEKRGEKVVVMFEPYCRHDPGPIMRVKTSGLEEALWFFQQGAQCCIQSATQDGEL
tara:strand:+ start:1017 stop:1229 length:213 start_codon:yes stop_codon:yes gene_type:complete